MDAYYGKIAGDQQEVAGKPYITCVACETALVPWGAKQCPDCTFYYDTPFWDENTDYEWDLAAEYLAPPEDEWYIYDKDDCFDCMWSLTTKCAPYADWLELYHNSVEIPDPIPDICSEFKLSPHLRSEKDIT